MASSGRPSTQSLKSLTSKVADLCHQARTDVILPLIADQDWQRHDKDGHRRNYVTDIDLKTESFLVTGLKDLLPDAGLIAEEQPEQTSPEGYEWVVDPIDGTTNLMHGLPPFCISVGLLYEREPVLGVILEITTNECFTAWKDGGAYLNEQAIRVSQTPNLEDSLLCSGFPYDQSDEPYFDRWLTLYGSLAKQTHGVRRLGAAAVDLAYVAAGRLEGFYEYNLEPWDVAAGLVLVQEAGGRVSNFHDGEKVIFRRQLIASNGHIHGALAHHIQAHLNA